MPINISESSAELIPHNLLVKLQAVYDTLKSAEKKAADLLLEKPKFFSEVSIVEAAEVGGCSEATLVTASHLSPKDVLIAISHSGRTRSIVDVVKYAKVTGATIISITNYPISPLVKKSDILLLTAAFTEHVNGEVMSKRVAELCILESLFINVLIRQKGKLIEDLNRSNTALEINKL